MDERITRLGYTYNERQHPGRDAEGLLLSHVGIETERAS